MTENYRMRRGYSTPLGQKLRQLAYQRTERCSELRDMADAFDKAVRERYADPTNDKLMRQMVKVWAEARKLYSSISGENLV